MSARRPKRARRIQDKAKRLRAADMRHYLERSRSREATENYVPVRNHRVVSLCIRLSDMALGEGPGLFSLPFDNGPACFMEGFRHWPSGEFGPEAKKFVIKDWAERPLYSTVDL